MSGVDYINVPEDVLEQVQGLMLDQFRDSENINKFLDIIAEDRQETEEEIANFSLGFLLKNAVGAQLDLIGEFINIYRMGEGDTDYRTRIALTAYSSQSNISRDSIVELLKLVLDRTPDIYLGQFLDYYYYIQDGCFSHDTIGDEIERFMPIGSQTQVVITEGIPFGFEGSEGGFFGTSYLYQGPSLSLDFSNQEYEVLEPNADGYFEAQNPGYYPDPLSDPNSLSGAGKLSSRVYLTMDTDSRNLTYKLDSNRSQAISLGDYTDSLRNIEDFRHMSLQLENPQGNLYSVSAHGQEGINNIRILLRGSGDVGGVSLYDDKVYYEIIPTEVHNYGLGTIQHTMYAGSVDFGGNNNYLSVIFQVNDSPNQDTTATLQIGLSNSDGTSCYFEHVMAYGDGSEQELEGKVFGITVDRRLRKIKWHLDGVDQGYVQPNSSDDPNNPLGEDMDWTDKRAEKALFYMTGLRTETPRISSTDTLSLKWNYKANQMSSYAPEDVRDMFGVTV